MYVTWLYGKPENTYDLTGLHYFGERYYDSRLSLFFGVDPLASDYPNASPYNYVLGNPIRFIDPSGDTLRAVNSLSAQRAEGIIQGTFNGMGMKGYAVAQLFQVGSDGVTFDSIDKGAFNSAIQNLDADGKALAYGYYSMINESSTNMVEVVKSGEKISLYGRAVPRNVSNTTELNSRGGGWTGSAYYDGKNVRMGNDGSYGIILMNPTSKISYSNGLRPSLPGELMAHELLGHGFYQRGSGFVDTSIQSGNAFLRATGHNYFRPDHSPGLHSPIFNPHAPPGGYRF